MSIEEPTEERDKQLAAAISLLEYYGEDLRNLAELDEPLRIRLVSAAGKLSRPDRYSRKNLGKVLMRQRTAAKREADQALLDETGIRALRREPVFKTPLPRVTLPNPDQALDAPVRDDEGPDDGGWAAAEAEREDQGASPPRGARVVDPQSCYVCKNEFFDLHFFYDQMCGPCAELNYRKRDEHADLRGRVYIVTGARVKIGYQAAIKLLRCGAEVIVLTRFPRDAARRFMREPDGADFAARLHCYGIDLRHTPSVELLCQHL
ncbi:MAG: oxidoreductase, partial [Proteobacteria bacterium]|nr:oxidoreductase [Pseudomonadota bacterium]